jgi:hypothetical protein
MVQVLELADTPFRPCHSSEKPVNVAVAALLAERVKLVEERL